MTSSSSRVRWMEQDLRMWWRICQEGNPIYRANPDDPRLADIQDEAETLADKTDWPLLRETIRHCRQRDHDRIAARSLRA